MWNMRLEQGEFHSQSASPLHGADLAKFRGGKTRTCGPIYD